MTASSDPGHPAARGRGPRGLSREAILDAAIEVLEERGEAGLSMRAVGAAAGCDAMSVTYHFGSKEGLLRAMAAWVDDQVDRVEPIGPVATAPDDWAAALVVLAHRYRAVALRRPRTFGLLQRFTHTGAADHAHSETVHRALLAAGVEERDVPGITLGWFAAVIGLATAETSGLVAPVDAATRAEIAALPADRFAATHRVADGYGRIEPADVFDRLITALHAGIAGA